MMPPLVSRATLVTFIAAAGITFAGCSEDQRPTAPTTVIAAAPLADSAPDPATDAAPTRMRIESFAVGEYQYANSAAWFYVPLVRLAASDGAGVAKLTRFDLSIPGMGAFGGTCGVRSLAAGESADLITELYGSWQVEYGGTPGERAIMGGTASLTVTVVDGRGEQQRLSASGLVVPGAQPATYSGGVGTWSFCR